MHSHRFANVWAEVFGQPGGAEAFVPIVDANVRAIFRQIVKQVANVVKESGDHGGQGRSLLVGGPRRLQGVFGLADWFAKVGCVAAGREELDDLGDQTFDVGPRR
jgi:hypothetical protein